MEHERVRKRSQAWVRAPPPNQDYYNPDIKFYIKNLFHKWPKFSRRKKNWDFDIYTKRAALRVSPSVVALTSYTGEEELNHGSGTIIESDENNTGIVLASANLVRRRSHGSVGKNLLAENLKIVVRLSNDRTYNGDVYAHDFHFNLVAISFKADSTLSTATLRHVNDCLDMNPEVTSFELRPHSSLMNLTPGDAVIAVGRYFAKPFDLMAAPGEFDLARCEYDCRELFMTTCMTTECGDGAPLINLSGEVIGITFYDIFFSPFMPINVAYKWWEHYKIYRKFRRPCLGMEAIGLHAACLDTTEKLIQRFPSISKGVIVEKVMPGFSADSAGLRLNDVIIECGGKVVQSFLELFEILWDNVGHHVEMVVARADHTTPLHLKLMVDEPELNELNSWPSWR